MEREDILEQFDQLGGMPEDHIDLAWAALLIAAVEYPDLDVMGQYDVLDDLANGAARRLGDDSDPLSSVNNLSEYLFDEVGFQGNESEYYDPRNSYLNEVLARRMGIPITLSLVCIEVGKRLGVPLEGVGMPGHFLLRHLEEPSIYIDPFHRGILLSEEECAQLLRDATRSNVKWDQSYLTVVSNRELIARILRNLKGIYLKQRDHQRALGIAGLSVSLQPNIIGERRDRGMIHYQLGNREAALEDLRVYLAASPLGPDTLDVRRIVQRIEGDSGG
jgi:regulator of sirC expression with transglutaminase-like and TPR domain